MAMSTVGLEAAKELAALARGRKYKTILADPPWCFTNRTGKMGARASAAIALRNHDPRRHLRVAGRG